MKENNTVYFDLCRRAAYALNSRSLNLVHETFGAAKMAYQLDAITKEEFYVLNDQLVRHGMNDPQYCKDHYGGVLE